MGSASSITSKHFAKAEDVAKEFSSVCVGKHVVITGGNIGLGLETARVLAINGAKVVICSRSVKNGDNAITEIKKTHPNVDITTMQLDLASFKSVLAFVAAYKATGKPLNLLINNAGIMACPRTLTVDGFESQFGVNHLGHFLLTNELLPLLVASGTSASPSRVINLSSFGNWLMSSPSGIKFDDLWAERSYSPYSRYGESKLANILFTRELSRRLVQQNQNVITVSVHPGVILSTGLNKHTDFATISSAMSAMWRRKGAFAEFSRDKGKDIPAGASTTVYAALSPDITTGSHYADCAEETKIIHEQAFDPTAWKRLWEVSEDMVNSKK